MSVLRIVLSSMKMQMKQTFSRSMYKYTIIAFPVFTGLLMGFVYSDRPNVDFVSYAMIGTATMTMWSSIAFSSASDVNRERYMGALAQIFNTPGNFYYIMLGKVLGNTLMGSISMIFSFVFVGLVFGVPILISNPVAFILVFLFSLLSYIMISMMLSGVLAISRQARVLMNSMDYIVFLLTGSVFPIIILPISIRLFSYVLSPTYAIHLLRLSVQSKVISSEFIAYSIGLAVTTLLYFVASVYVYKRIEIKARINATLEVV